MASKITIPERKLINDLVDHFIRNPDPFKRALSSIHGFVENSSSLKPLIHSVKYRIKDPDHLRDKLERKLQEAKAKNKPFTINSNNLFSRINDLIGYRIIHLHTKQFELIDAQLKAILAEQEWLIVEGPSAKTWDDESREYFKNIGVNVSKSPNLYTSVHYIIKPNSKSKITCEIQVRTLMEEVWGEVDHSINYPHKSDVNSIREQIKVLARVTSSCSRLVDSIFSTNDEHTNSLITLTSLKEGKNIKKATSKANPQTKTTRNQRIPIKK